MCAEWIHHDKHQKPRKTRNVNLTAVISFSAAHHASALAAGVRDAGSETRFVEF